MERIYIRRKFEVFGASYISTHEIKWDPLRVPVKWEKIYVYVEFHRE